MATHGGSECDSDELALNKTATNITPIPMERYHRVTEGSTTSDQTPVCPNVLNGDWDAREGASGDRCKEETQKKTLQPSRARDNEECFVKHRRQRRLIQGQERIPGGTWLSQVLKSISRGKKARKERESKKSKRKRNTKYMTK
ncbi:hypothetical protein NDU88_005389 [Pleurodeles waltl]|uniref:Uncharacterized protein n=1 Tax=Pleurodeles waltl TaxID=8319 RepID=A0AAV7TVA5_PLEWA|nr:hypothetical protein NDU88_005389 [Pleurodeles waltl]